MANKMLIDAAHPEETRVVVLRGSRVEEFDFESANKRQLRGNIYLAKVTRVEPSLQAAFIDYGGNRHGFLAFSEIHPDYYQIPVSDRQALLDADAEEETEEEQQEERRPRRSRRRRGDRNAASARRDGDETVSEAASPDGSSEPAGHDAAPAASTHADDTAPADELVPIAREASQKPPYDDPTADLIAHASMVHAEETDAAAPSETGVSPDAHEQPALVAAATETAEPASDADVDTGSSTVPDEGHAHEHVSEEHAGAAHQDDAHQDDAHQDDSHEDDEDDDEHGDDEHGDEEDHVENIGGDAMEEIPVRAYRPRRQYKIQEVIKRRQVLLVQVVKEERGNKGAALTTYLSLAGRYSVLMPNTARGGGISRKITDATDRQRLKSIAQALEVPDGMGVILRTAGAARSTPEVKRDFEYLMRMWETVRETTLGSSAPTLVYEEGSLIKRAIRDLYNKDVEEVVVAGEEGYREAKEFMRLLMPSHAKNVQPWRDAQPIFTKAGAEAQLDAMFSSQVTLKSGGYIVINQTEALVAIDVNSGRSTREHNIEDTALRTNLEAADEVARQLRLRDLAGLIVVDFIDMEEGRNNRAVERRIKDALKDDRARIQVGRISHFGLLEMSRQRIRSGVLEGSTVMCEHCAGSGSVRSTSSIALHVLRLLEDALILDASRNILVRARGIVALYVLNQKRAHLADLEARFGVAISIVVDDHQTGTTYCGLERGEPATGVPQPLARQVQINVPEPEDLVEEETTSEEEEATETTAETDSSRDSEDGRRKRRRRRGRGRDREPSGITDDAPQPADDALAFVTEMDGSRQPAPVLETADMAEGADEQASDAPKDEDGKTRRRSRRGGRRARESRERAETREQEPGQEGGFEAAGEISASHDAPSMEAATHAASDEGDAPHADSPDVMSSAQTRVEPEISREIATEVRTPAEVPEMASAAPEVVPAQVVPSPVAPEPVAAEPVGATPEPVEAGPPPMSEEPHAAEDEPVSAPRRPEPVSSEADPARPKRSGWWQRAKATLGG